MEAVKFLLSLFCDSDPDHYLEITLLDDRYKDTPYQHEGGDKRYPMVGWLAIAEMNDKLEVWLARAALQNADGMGVYFGACARHEKRPKGKRALKSSVASAPALWADIDCGLERIEVATMFLKSFVHAPTLIVATGGGVQAWWALRAPLNIRDKTDQKAFEGTLKGLAKATGGDSSVADVARIMRLPGFANMKPDRGAYAAHVVYETGVLYDYAAFAGYAALSDPPKRRAPVTSSWRNDKRPRMTNKAEAFLANGAPKGTRHQTLIHVVFQFKEKGLDYHACWMEAGHKAMEIGLPENEVVEVLDWVYKKQ